MEHVDSAQMPNGDGAAGAWMKETDVNVEASDGNNGETSNHPLMDKIHQRNDDYLSGSNDVDDLDIVAQRWARRDSAVGGVSLPGSLSISLKDEVCGWGPFQPHVCQQFRRPAWVLVWLSLAGVCQGMVVNGFVLNSISTLERRFDLKSSETGIIASGYDFASLVCLIPVSYFGGVGRKPQWVSIGVLIMSAGSLLYMVPHFTADIYDPFRSGNVQDTCQVIGNVTKQTINCGRGLLSNYKYVFIFGQLLHGVGATPLYTLGVSYMDDNLLPSMTSFYVGIFYSLSIIGPAIGFLLGGFFLSIYTDIGRVDLQSVQITSKSPKWVGAWWIGFIIAACLGSMVSCVLFGFPKSLPGRKEILKEKVSEAHGEKGQSGAFSGSFREFPHMLKCLMTNPTFVCISLAGATEGLILSGFATFAPKFVENQFSTTASFASVVVGAIAVSAGGGGTFFGGWIIKHKDLKMKGIVKLCTIFAATSFVLCFGYLVRCTNTKFAGVLESYTNETVVSLDAQCNSHCHCSREVFNPVCDKHNVMYFSACHAGCAGPGFSWPQQGKINPLMYYGNCTCLAPNDTLDDMGHQVVEGKCEGQCELLPIFLFFFFGVTVMTFLASMPALSATLRSVPENQKSFALGIQWLIVRAFGTIPAAPIIGGIIDHSCVLWQEDCGSYGSCYAYDNSKMGIYLMSAGLTVKFLSVSFLFATYVVYKPPTTHARDESFPEIDFMATQSDVNNPQPNKALKETTEL